MEAERAQNGGKNNPERRQNGIVSVAPPSFWAKSALSSSERPYILIIINRAHDDAVTECVIIIIHETASWIEILAGDASHVEQDVAYIIRAYRIFLRPLQSIDHVVVRCPV